jgi:hypothetical protein
MSPPVPLGREVRDWVLVPLTLTIGLMMVMRQYAMVSAGWGAGIFCWPRAIHHTPGSGGLPLLGGPVCVCVCVCVYVCVCVCV